MVNIHSIGVIQLKGTSQKKQFMKVRKFYNLSILYRIPIILCLIIVSCNTRDDLDSFVLEEPKEYNDLIAQATKNGEEWVNDPILIANYFFRGDERRVLIDYQVQSVDHVLLTAVQEGLKDDSVFGIKRIIIFQRSGGYWWIENIKMGFKCQKNRGQAHYSGDLCI
jgi:hypothetical protein